MSRNNAKYSLGSSGLLLRYNTLDRYASISNIQSDRGGTLKADLTCSAMMKDGDWEQTVKNSNAYTAS